MSEDLGSIRALSNRNFAKMLRLVELGINNWWTASSILAIANDNLTEKQKEQIRKSYEEKFGEFPDVDSFLKLGRRRNRFEESFFLPYENHIKYHEKDSKLTNPEPDCIICQLIEKTGSNEWKNGHATTDSQDAA